MLIVVSTISSSAMQPAYGFSVHAPGHLEHIVAVIEPHLEASCRGVVAAEAARLKRQIPFPSSLSSVLQNAAPTLGPAPLSSVLPAPAPSAILSALLGPVSIVAPNQPWRQRLVAIAAAIRIACWDADAYAANCTNLTAIACVVHEGMAY